MKTKAEIQAALQAMLREAEERTARMIEQTIASGQAGLVGGFSSREECEAAFTHGDRAGGAYARQNIAGKWKKYF